MFCYDEEFENALATCGTTYHLRYLGNVPVDAPIHDMSPDFRPLVVKECVSIIAEELHISQSSTIQNQAVRMMLGDACVTDRIIEFNITPEALVITQHDPDGNTNLLIHRHPIPYVALASVGDQTFSDIFGYIAKRKNGSDRRCYVIQVIDIKVQQVLRSIHEAINIASEREQHHIPIRKAPPPPPPPPAENAPVRRLIRKAPLPPRLPVLSSTPIQTTPINNIPLMNVNGNSRDLSLAIDDDLSTHIWYHGLLSREEAESKLTNIGDFLVRKSTSDPRNMVISSRIWDNTVRHARIMEEYYANQFVTLPRLVHYHIENEQPLILPDTAMYLITPIARS